MNKFGNTVTLSRKVHQLLEPIVKMTLVEGEVQPIGKQYLRDQLMGVFEKEYKVEYDRAANIIDDLILPLIYCK